MKKPLTDDKFQSSEIHSLNQESVLNLNSQKTTKQMPIFADLYKEFVRDVEQKKQDSDRLIKKRIKYGKILNIRKTQNLKKKVLINHDIIT